MNEPTKWTSRTESGTFTTTYYPVQELGLNDQPLPTEAELAAQEAWLDENWGPLPHYHACRPFDRARHHANDLPCFDADDKPEKQHAGYLHICRKCADEVERKYPMPDDGHDDPRYGGY